MTINVVLLPFAASNYASFVAIAYAASVVTLAADIVPPSLPSDAPSQAALLHVQMLVRADSSH
jgi:heme exporter protein CcmD